MVNFIKEAVTHINSIDSSKFSRLLSRILQKLHLKLDLVGWQLNLQMASSARSRLKAPHAVLNLGLRTEDDTERLQDVSVEFNHQDLLDFYNQMEMIQTQLDSLS
ncbi:COMM domain-containing protein 10-like [Sinocyclocheilus anshuiensis]|uniref:COMM domain-containing protein 10-like n=1 Tax=Sinocyclocheilus anshuiensis TaxID=1608454 RepID=UPI0007B81934|nr:PREDICTED: COMM domain-containing protein 10-like [Sinocyclocheilus anshuiensis]